MTKPRITLIGLGDTGKNIGLGLLKEPGDFEVVGHDRNTDAETEAKRIGAVHRTEWNLHTAVEGASLVVLALPLPDIISTFGHIADDLAPTTLVFAVNSLLQPVTEAAAALLPNHHRVVAGHPVILKPSGTVSAEALRNVIFCLAVAPHTDPASVELASDLVERVGATPHFVDIAEHDGIVAGVEQLPQLLGAALMSVSTGGSGWKEARQLAGRRFVQASGLIGEPDAAAAAFVQNRAALLQRIDEMQRELAQWRTLIESAELPAIAAATPDTGRQSAAESPAVPSPLLDALQRAAEEQETWRAQSDAQSWESEPEPASAPGGGLLRQLFLGNIGRRKTGDDRTTRR